MALSPYSLLLGKLVLVPIALYKHASGNQLYNLGKTETNALLYSQ